MLIFGLLFFDFLPFQSSNARLPPPIRITVGRLDYQQWIMIDFVNSLVVDMSSIFFFLDNFLSSDAYFQWRNRV